ncbi:family 43 glycosylhydrolase [Flavitalea sp. BT771]|uniref:family 43 glycosylhydrolase n=1 Tax=Flavitalea sp. BT771 TaxID=3063329 RepID=UPI0026E27ECB|nr:family 43 glycosylhydrolase [Flavitalea sp. BT771]MDO6430329.1 family 43 glycosylhydrolase [Flavitalea sp. BT771]MDV6219531.1 family 43 glycosylhydrolase [Flavitalea sp. BT771]
MKKDLLLGLCLLLAARGARAQNPFIMDQYSADPSARVFGDSVYVYPSHDIRGGNGKGRADWFCMEDYHAFSSADLRHWYDHGMIVSQDKVHWVDTASYSMWAPDCIFHNGKYYFYFPSRARNAGGFAVGVAVADKPYGPFIPQDQPIKDVHGIDPNVFIDKDGQAYLYWAQGKIYGARLKDNMVELASEPVVLGELPEKGLKEGPYMIQRNGIYYLTYPHVENKTERLEYAMGSQPLGPFKVSGVIMDEWPDGCWTNHQSIIQFKDQWYLFYHHDDLSPSFDKNRSVRVDSLFFNADGTIRKVAPTLRGVGLTGAEEMIQVDRYSAISAAGARISFLDSSDRFRGWKLTLEATDGWVRYNGVVFGEMSRGIAEIRAASPDGGAIGIRADAMDGPVIATAAVPAGGAWSNIAASVSPLKPGVHDLFIKSLKGKVEVDWIRFPRNGLTHTDQQARNPIIYADVPDMSIIRVGDTYYMSSTTMHMSPGVPIMRSKDLVNWDIVGYAYDRLDDVDELDLNNGKSAYGRGSWASSLRYHDGRFYVSTFSGTTGKTYIYTTQDIEKGPWKAVSFKPSLHDNSLFFDEDGKAYMLYGSGKIMLAELNDDLSGIREGTTPQMIIEDASSVAGPIGLRAEGSQLFRIDGKYYLFNITWPRGGMRTVTIHRADRLTGPYVGRVALQDKGVAQGGLINTPNGEWYAYLFRDFGAVGRVPYMVPVQWQDGWPVLGVDHRAPDTVALPISKGLDPGIVASDDFSRQKGAPAFPLVWQWNHNPDNSRWSLDQRPGYLRLTTGRVDTSLLLARNTLTQRTFGPGCSGVTAIDVSHMKEGDQAGLLLLQKKYGWVGVRVTGNKKYVVSVREGTTTDSVALTQRTVYLRADCDFRRRADKGCFYYSLDGKNWKPVGTALKMEYTLPHFMGYRFGLFNYATKTPGGYVDFDYFHIGEAFSSTEN